MVHVDAGWVRNADDGAAALTQLSDYSIAGPTGQQISAAIISAMGPIVSCWEAVDLAHAVVKIQVSAPGSPVDDRLEVSVESRSGQARQPADALRLCVDRALRETLPMPVESDAVSATVKMFRRQDEARLRQVDAHAEVAVRLGGSCWQWADYPCAPNKSCMADEWVRTGCGDPTMRNDVTLHYGVGPAGKATELRLVGADGRVLWATPIPTELRAEGMRFAGKSSVAVRGRGSTRLSRVGIPNVLVVDDGGLQLLERTTGKRLLSLVASRGKSALWFDDGTYTIKPPKSAACTGSANHGAFVAQCDGRRFVFDGERMVVITDDPPKAIGARQIRDRGVTSSLERGKRRVAFRVAGYRVTIQGQIYMN